MDYKFFHSRTDGHGQLWLRFDKAFKKSKLRSTAEFLRILIDEALTKRGVR